MQSPIDLLVPFEGVRVPATGSWKEKIERFEEQLLKHPDVDFRGERLCQLFHHFGPGIYMRENRRPAKCFILGDAHKTRHFNILLSGDLAVFMDGKVTRMQAPHIFISEAGVRKLTYTEHGASLLTIHPTDETDLDKLEDDLTEKTPACLQAEIEAARKLLSEEFAP